MKLTKATALKGALFMVLAANMSWEKLEVSSLQLAQTGTPKEVTAASGGASAPTGDGKVSTAPAALAVKADGAAPVPVAVAAAPAPVVQKPSAPTPYDGELKICGDTYKVRFEETETGGEKMTSVTAQRAGSTDGTGSVSTILRATLAQTIWEKESAQRILTTHVKEARTKQKLACNEPAAAGTTADATKDDAKTEADEEKKAQADAVKNCKRDARGKSLDKDDQITCWTTALEHASKRVERKGANGKRLSEEALSKAILADLQNSQKELKKLLKNALLSDDESRVELARESITSAMTAIQDQADTYDLSSTKSGRKNSTVSKMVDQLAALQKGSEVKEEAAKYSERAKDVKEQSRLARNQMDTDRQNLLRNPLDPNANLQYAQSRQDFALVMADYEGLRREIGMNFEPLQMTPFKKFQSQGMIDRGDFNEFSKGFSEIQRLMKDTVGGLSNRGDASSLSARTIGTGAITGSVLGNDYTPPTDLAAVRNAGGTATYRTGSSTGVPTINLPQIPGTSAVPTNTAVTNGRRW